MDGRPGAPIQISVARKGLITVTVTPRELRNLRDFEEILIENKPFDRRNAFLKTDRVVNEISVNGNLH